MIIITEKGKGKVKLTDKQMSVIMSGLAVATVHWNELADQEVTTTSKDLLVTSFYLLKTYAKSAGISEKDVIEAIKNSMKTYKKGK